MPRMVAYLTSMWLPNAPGGGGGGACLNAEPVHEQRDAGVQRRLRQLNRAHIVLRDLHLDRIGSRDRSMQNISERASVLDDSRRARGQAPVEHSVLVDDAGEIHLGDH